MTLHNRFSTWFKKFHPFVQSHFSLTILDLILFIRNNLYVWFILFSINKIISYFEYLFYFYALIFLCFIFLRCKIASSQVILSQFCLMFQIDSLIFFIYLIILLGCYHLELLTLFVVFTLAYYVKKVCSQVHQKCCVCAVAS